MTAPLAPTSTDRPDFTDYAYRAQREAWGLVDDCLSGTPAIRAAREKYLPRGEAEETDNYEKRLNRARFYNFYRRALKGLTGRVFRRAPKLAGDTPQMLLQHAEDIDGEGTHFAVFARRLFRHCLHHGHGAILIDAPPDTSPALGRVPTRKDEALLGIRPYWIRVDANQILNARTTRRGGRTVLEQVTIREEHLLPSGRFGEQCVVTYRVYTLEGPQVRFAVWEERAQSSRTTLLLTEQGYLRRFTEIPVIPVYTEEPEGWFRSRPVLYELAETNLDHYVVQNDHVNSLHIASVPIPIFAGRLAKDAMQPYGNGWGVDISEGGKAFFLEHTGAALGASLEWITRLETRMAYQSLSLMERQTNQAETADSKRMDRLEQESILAVAARGLQDALEQAWKLHAQAIEQPAPSLTVNFDFDGLTLTSDQIQQYRENWLSGGYDLDTFWDLLEAGGQLPEDFNRAKVRDAIAQEALLRGSSPIDLGGNGGAPGDAALLAAAGLAG